MRNALPPFSRRVALVAVLALLMAPAAAGAQLKRELGSGLTDAAFWQMFTTMSEPGGSFVSENFVSNEMGFQLPIPTLQRTVRPGGVYLGVGPEQNFTYIANLKPRLAIIFDIRRQNAMAHLMYKAMFELSPTRGDFVSRLFSRPLAARVGTTTRVDDLMAVTRGAAPSDSAYAANRRAVFATLVDRHRFVLTPGDSASIEHLLSVFYEAGPDLNYAYRPGRGAMLTAYPSFGLLQARTNADSVQMAFLATEENYRAVRDMHLRNLIVPVVGDFAGPKAIRAVGEFLRERQLTVSAFYLSNVEQYLFQNGVASRFYENVATLPIDSTSMFIRSVTGGGGGGLTFTRALTSFGNTGGFAGSSISITNDNGRRTVRITQDSAGSTVTRTYRDSAGALVLQRTDTGSAPVQILIPAPAGPLMGGASPIAMGRSLLTSGIAPIGKTLADFAAGRILDYQDIIAMTRIDGWK